MLTTSHYTFIFKRLGEYTFLMEVKGFLWGISRRYRNEKFPWRLNAVIGKRLFQFCLCDCIADLFPSHKSINSYPVFWIQTQ